MAVKQTGKTCFVICPIGESGDEVRNWSDDVFFGLIQPIADDFGYVARRAIDDAKPGEITNHMIRDIFESDLVIADLTLLNPNVFYEIGIRHITKKPYIHLARAGTKIPFDTAGIGTIFIESGSFSGSDRARDELRSQLKMIEEDALNFENPVSRYRERITIEESGDPSNKVLIEILDRLDRIESHPNMIADQIELRDKSRPKSGLFLSYEGWNSLLKSGDLDSSIDKSDLSIENSLKNQKYRLFFNPKNNKSKIISFENDGLIGDGRNENENTWRVKNGFLEIFGEDKKIFSRFLKMKNDNQFVAIQNNDTRNIDGQFIKPLSLFD
ncbi:MAG: hypothetical protein ACMVY4_05905 [Minwuia sp.]|uniref:hypothetical protein n=1 Tax=Minwuia sp. TaxID=2493630 RepID=UPI003A8C73AC